MVSPVPPGMEKEAYAPFAEGEQISEKTQKEKERFTYAYA